MTAETGKPAAVPAFGDAVLDARLVVDRGAFRLDLPLTIGPGEVVALLGPNGAGKTTALRALAGLLPLTAGHLRLAGRHLDHPDRRVWIPAEQRGIGVVFQDYLLFPHLNALDNVAFGPRRQGLSRHRARQRAARWLTRVGLAEHARRKPRQLSGGQAQRVALARALAVAPALLLLDEPLAALDARTRLDTRAQLQHHLGGHTGATLLVTHDPIDAVVLADRLVVIEDGHLVQEGDVATVIDQPRTDFVARLVGLNLHRGHADGHRVRVTDGFHLVVGDRHTGDVFVAFTPSTVALHPRRPDGGTHNTWPATVTGIQRHGDHLRVQLAGPVAVTADITPAAAARLTPRPGQTLWATVDAAGTRVYPATPTPRAEA